MIANYDASSVELISLPASWLDHMQWSAVIVSKSLAAYLGEIRKLLAVS